MQISITLPNGEVETKQFHKGQISIGRSNQCDFVVPNESLSRQHCLIELVDGNFFVTDLGSSNGVYLDGQRVPANSRTPFTTFMQLSIGPMECQVADSDEGHQARPLIDSSAVAPTPSATSRPRPASKEKVAPKPKVEVAKSPTKKKNSLPLIAFVVVVAAVIYHYVFNQKENVTHDPVTTESLMVEKNVPLEFRAIKDATLSAGEYEAIESEKSCADAALCKELKLSTDKAEGIVQKNGEYFIFVHESHLALTPLILNSALKQKPDALDLAVLFDILNSQLFTQFQQKKIGQIHVIMKNGDYKNFRLYRFHTKYFTSNEQARLLTELGTSLSSGDTANFWNYAKPIIKTQDF